jgi:hypothetical protein
MAVGQQWKHNWIPLTPGAMRQKNHGRDVKAGSWVTKIDGASVHSGHKGSGVHRITNAQGQHQYVSGSHGDKVVERAAASKHSTVERHTSGHEKELASAPKAVRDVWDAARQRGWTVSLFAPKDKSGTGGKDRTHHDVQLVSPDGKTKHELHWIDGKRSAYGGTSTRKALADINNHGPSAQMDDKIRAAVGKSSVPSAPQSKEDRFLAESRAKQAKIDEERRQQIARHEAAQARQKEARGAVAAKIAKEKRDAEAGSKGAERNAERKAAEQKAGIERATELNNLAARAYKAGDYDKALNILDQAAASDPSRADVFKSRRDRVLKAQQEAKASGKVPADVQRLREMDAARKRR